MRKVCLCCLTLLLSTPVVATWREANTDKFIVYSEGSEKSLVEFVERVDKFDQLLRLISHRGDAPIPVKVRIYLVDSQSTVRELYPAHIATIAGFYLTTLRGGIGVVNRTRASNEYQLDGETILCHEYAHHFMAQYFRAAYPRWYQEGFAELFANVEFQKNGQVTLGVPPLYRMWGLHSATWIGMERLMDDSARTISTKELDAFYAQSWLLTHYVFDNSERATQLRQYFQLRNQGLSHADAMQKAFGLSDPQFDEELRGYLKRGRVHVIEFKSLNFVAPRISVRELAPSSDQLLLQDLRIDLGMSDDEGKKALQSIRSKANTLQDDDARLILARAEARYGDRARAVELLQALVAKDPPNRRALLELAALRLSGAEEGHDARLAADRAARTLAARANRLDRNDPEALYLFYQSFAHEADGPTQNALAALEQAYASLPQYWPVAASLVHELVRTRENKRAIQVLRPWAYAAHGGKAAEWAQAQLKDLEEQQESATVDADGH
jgi:hypothetical protein